MIREECGPFLLRKEFYFEPSYEERLSLGQEQLAIWTFNRIGRTTTVYRDKYFISIGGEHEDPNDPDYLVYNDVVVRDLNGGIWIYGYPKDVFPPTDFHTATLANDKVIILGGLGYQSEQEYWRTPVFVLDLEDLMIRPMETTGPEPGWIFGHSAALCGDSLVRVFDGEVITENGSTNMNTNLYELDLYSQRWTLLGPNC